MINDPEIIEKLDEIKRELSGIKDEAAKRRSMEDDSDIRELENIKWGLSGIKEEISKINGIFKAIVICFWVGVALWFIIEKVIPWIRDFLF